MAFAALSMRPDFYKEKINLMVALAPVVVPNRNSRLFKVSANISPVIWKTLQLFKCDEIYGKSWTQVQKISQ